MVRSRSYIATPPGATIKEQLNDREMSQKEFAARMDMSEKHISKLINGEVKLTQRWQLDWKWYLECQQNFGIIWRWSIEKSYLKLKQKILWMKMKR